MRLDTPGRNLAVFYKDVSGLGRQLVCEDVVIPGPRDAPRALRYGTLQHFRHREFPFLLDALEIFWLQFRNANFGFSMWICPQADTTTPQRHLRHNTGLHGLQCIAQRTYLDQRR